MATNISREVTRRLRTDLFRRISQLSAAQQDRLTDASLVSRLTTDTYNVHNMIDRMQRLGVRAPMLLVGGIIVSLITGFSTGACSAGVLRIFLSIRTDRR